ncbi:hypothetical protein DHOM_09625 [Dermabacter hominis 1368]|uniref:Acyl-CoA dehydrogenase/oxidase C-terminal domain-containing protein n=1 Tax=Dermabacter hominis 1368 TaxID=1450519 RepID=A0ABR4SI78_9MICO|nr:hypothetical protein DHOM_09625 [Dermabacter hominis 1368]
MLHGRGLHELGRLGAITRERPNLTVLAERIIRRKGPPLRERAHDVLQLACAMKLRAQVLTGSAMREVGRDLLDPKPLVKRVNRQAGFHAPPGGERLHGIPGFARDATRTTEGLHGLEPGGFADSVTGRFHHEAHASCALLRGERRDRHIHAVLKDRLDERLRT